MRTITITCRGANDFDVQEGERVCARLCWDEMLGAIAEMTHPAIGRSRFRMADGDAIIANIERRARVYKIQEREA